MLDNVYGKFANKVAAETVKSGKLNVKTLDPMTILMILKILFEVVKCYMSKKFSAEKALGMAQKPTFIDKALLKRFVREAIRDGDLPKGINKFVLRAELSEKLLEFGPTLKKEDIEELTAKFTETENFLDRVQRGEVRFEELSNGSE